MKAQMDRINRLERQSRLATQPVLFLTCGQTFLGVAPEHAAPIGTSTMLALRKEFSL